MLHSILNPNLTDAAILLLRVMFGSFFFLFRFRWFYDPSQTGSRWFCEFRREKLEGALFCCGWKRPRYWALLVAVAEVFGGLAVLVGFLTVPAALSLVVVCAFGCFCVARHDVKAKNPVDICDHINRYQWTTEVLYLVMGTALAISGPGAYSLDAWIWR